MPARKSSPKVAQRCPKCGRGAGCTCARNATRGLAKIMPARAAREFVNRMAAGKKRAVLKRFAGNPKSLADLTAAAAQGFEEFHGRPATRVQEIDYRTTEPVRVYDLGRLIYLDVIVGNVVRRLDFKGGVRATSTVSRGQLYIAGGDQEMDLKGLGVTDQLPKDHAEIGRIAAICYYTSKDFHNFEPLDYTHNFGEEDIKAGKPPRRPMLDYDVDGKQLFVVGGGYLIKPEGIVN